MMFYILFFLLLEGRGKESRLIDCKEPVKKLNSSFKSGETRTHKNLDMSVDASM